MKQPQYNTALYMRLSRDDETFGDSVSIETQRTVLTQYVREHPEFHVVSEFVDDGWSGTSFDRPQFKRMMEEIEAGNISCVISKDLSRFARDYLESGHYLEQVFPALGVRFISVNGGYDSCDFPYGAAGNVNNGLLNLINEMYSRDLSQKSKAAKRLFARRGQCINAYPVYGYLRAPEDKRAWIPDPEAAPVKQRIFALHLEGKGPTEIARVLNGEGVPTPAQHTSGLWAPSAGSGTRSGWRTLGAAPRSQRSSGMSGTPASWWR